MPHDAGATLSAAEDGALGAENGDGAAPEPSSPAQSWTATVSGVAMILTATVTILFGPELNAEQHFLSLDAQALNTVHWVLNGAWGLSFGLYALYGHWGELEPLLKSCHWLGSISIVAVALALDLNVTQKVSMSCYALAITIVVEWVYRWVTVVCRVVQVAVGAVVVVVQTTGGIGAAVGDLVTTAGTMVGTVGTRLGALVNVHP